MWKKYSGLSSCLEILSWQIMKIELLRFSSDAFMLCSEGELLLITVHVFCPQYFLFLRILTAVSCLH